MSDPFNFEFANNLLRARIARPSWRLITISCIIPTVSESEVMGRENEPTPNEERKSEKEVCEISGRMSVGLFGDWLKNSDSEKSGFRSFANDFDEEYFHKYIYWMWINRDDLWAIHSVKRYCRDSLNFADFPPPTAKTFQCNVYLQETMVTGRLVTQPIQEIVCLLSIWTRVDIIQRLVNQIIQRPCLSPFNHWKAQILIQILQEIRVSQFLRDFRTQDEFV